MGGGSGGGSLWGGRFAQQGEPCGVDVQSTVQHMTESCKALFADVEKKATLDEYIELQLRWRQGLRKCTSHCCKAKLKHLSSVARTDYVDYNHCTCKDTKAPYVYQGTDQNNSIHPLHQNINVVTMSTQDILRHFRKTQLYTRGYAVAHSYLLCTLGSTHKRIMSKNGRGRSRNTNNCI